MLARQISHELAQELLTLDASLRGVRIGFFYESVGMTHPEKFVRLKDLSNRVDVVSKLTSVEKHNSDDLLYVQPGYELPLLGSIFPHPKQNSVVLSVTDIASVSKGEICTYSGVKVFLSSGEPLLFRGSVVVQLVGTEDEWEEEDEDW